MITNRTRFITTYGSGSIQLVAKSPRQFLLLTIALMAIAGSFLLGAITVRAASPQDDLRGLNQNIEKAISLIQTGDKDGAQAAFKKFDDGWFNIEDGVKAQSRDTYKAIEDAMGDVKFAFSLQPFEQSKALE